MSVPQPIRGIASVSLEKSAMQRSVSYEDVEKESGTRRRASAELKEAKRDGGPFNLSGFFPTSFSAIRRGEEEWRWLRGEEEDGEEDEAEWEEEEESEGERGEGEGPLSGGSAIFGKETSEAIKGADKLGALLLTLKAVNLFSGSTGDAGTQLLSPYALDEVVDETSLYLAQRTRRERSDVAGAGEGSWTR
ncbi:hypothetical protein Agabi119p4_1222 [Agaricus bisporus var. burnettii]|uniref:Uncharacterized protein n=1 Tax=Agaricus bisporus var. burnettii TaxID=192524 RepID=A0A8H7FC12_AGABI|nr:hypothetical protein Agabi119p4_1222 [Agaricus bisporus var. burnettii]